VWEVPKDFTGIGVEVAHKGTSIKIVRVIEETPAQKAGVQPNDIITHLDDVSVEGLTLNQVVEKMRGQANTEVKLRIAREGQDAPIELSVRGVVQRPSVQPPSVQAPSVSWPSVQVPSVQWPSVQAPTVQWPSVQGKVQQ
jgi:C-terminal processing protease CtpA/Prc